MEGGRRDYFFLDVKELGIFTCEYERKKEWTGECGSYKGGRSWVPDYRWTDELWGRRGHFFYRPGKARMRKGAGSEEFGEGIQKKEDVFLVAVC